MEIGTYAQRRPLGAARKSRGKRLPMLAHAPVATHAKKKVSTCKMGSRMGSRKDDNPRVSRELSQEAGSRMGSRIPTSRAVFDKVLPNSMKNPQKPTKTSL
jgi:hypothetical protein